MKTYVVRPAAVLARNGSASLGYLLRRVAVRTDELAAVMVDLAQNGDTEQVVENKVILKRGKELLIKQNYYYI